MVKVAFLFPGQGSQTVGMGKDLYEEYSVAKNVYDKANSVLNKNISSLCFEGPEEELKQTINTQPCIVTTSIAILEVLKLQIDMKPYCVAGHSLGEYCAMYAAGVMDLNNTLLAIQKRAELMSSVQTGTMAAILNSTEDNINKAINESSEYGYVSVANYNSPTQIVITGDKEAVEKVGEKCLDMGARRVVPLAVSGAFHSQYMLDAANKFEKFVKDIKISDAGIPVFTNVDSNPTIDKEEFRIKMPKQICSSVYWTQTIQKMVESGVNIFVEIGPGTVLSGLNRKIVPEIKTYNICGKETMDHFINEYKNLEIQ